MASSSRYTFFPTLEWPRYHGSLYSFCFCPFFIHNCLFLQNSFTYMNNIKIFYILIHFAILGLMRVKSDIDSVSKNLLRSFFQLATIVSNLMMHCHTLYELSLTAPSTYNTSNAISSELSLTCQLYIKILIKSIG